MAMPKNDESTIGKRIGRLLRQYQLRIEYAAFKSRLYEDEHLRASALGEESKAIKASVSAKVWAVYAQNLTDKKNELAEAIRNALIGYNTKEKSIWLLYFIENKSSYEIENELNLNSRTVQRIVAQMKADMELKLRPAIQLPIADVSPKWGAQELASFLAEKPSCDYVAAVKDLIEYGIVNMDALEFDQDFQDYLLGKRP